MVYSKKKMTTRWEGESTDDIKFYLKDPRNGVERQMNLEDSFSKDLIADKIQDALIIISIIKKKTKKWMYVSVVK